MTSPVAAVLSDPGYRRLFVSGLFVNVARWMDLVTLGWLTLQLTGSPFLVGLALDNVFDVKWNEAQFATTSRLPGEAQPTTELHFAPGSPRSIVLSAQIRF